MQRTPRVQYPWRFVLPILPHFLHERKCGVFRCGGVAWGIQSVKTSKKMTLSVAEKQPPWTTGGSFPAAAKRHFFTASGLAGDGQS